MSRTLNFDLHVKNINEIVNKESEFLSNVEKQFELKKPDHVLDKQENTANHSSCT